MRKRFNINEYSGRVYGKLTIQSFAGYAKGYKIKVTAICECGVIKDYHLSALKNSNTTSCGCVRKITSSEKAKRHGMGKHPLYQKWGHIIQRCENKKEKKYHRYGGRGITVCKEWRENFMSFYNWAISTGWQKGLYIDRINNDGNYEPNNCRFVTNKQNCNNTSTNVIITFNGESKTISEWAAKVGLDQSTLWARIRKGWHIEDALFAPLGLYMGSSKPSKMGKIPQIKHSFGYITNIQKKLQQVAA